MLFFGFVAAALSWVKRKFLVFLVAQRFGSGAAFGFLRGADLSLWCDFGLRVAMGFGSGAARSWARQVGCESHQLQHNKALHPTAYSFARRSSSLRFRRRVSLVVMCLLIQHLSQDCSRKE